MSKYTTEVRFICEKAAELEESVGFDDIDEVLTAAAPVVFNFDFPIYDESYRIVLEKNILRHYYTREICEEVVGLWKLRLQDRLTLIMPYYNELYRSQLLEYNPLYDVDITRTHTREIDETNNTTDTGTNTLTGKITRTGSTTKTGTGTRTNTENGTENNNENGTNWDLYSDTPQGGIQGIEGGDVESMKYLSNARKLTNSRGVTSTTTLNGTEGSSTNESESASSEDNRNDTISNTNTSNGTVNNVEEYTERVFGKQGTENYAKMIAEFRKNILRIDNMIIEELSDLFFGLW